MSEHYDLRKLREHVSLDRKWAAVGAAHVDLRKQQVAFSEETERARAALANQRSSVVARECAVAERERRAQRRWKRGQALVVTGVILWVSGLLCGGWWLVEKTQLDAKLKRAGITLSGERLEDLR